MTRGKQVWSSEWVGTRYYVGTTPYGRDIIVDKDVFDETCRWFDDMQASNWQQF